MGSKVIQEGELEGIEDRLHYNPDTGEITYLKDYAPYAYKGKAVTSLDSHGYVRVSFKGKRYLGHRVAYFLMKGYLPFGDIDHINGNRSDNRWDNLRAVTRSENLHRQKKSRGKSIYKGVARHQERRWLAQCRDTKNGKGGYVGTSLSEQEAALMYNHRAEQLFGKYARFNIVFEDVSKEVLDGET